MHTSNTDFFYKLSVVLLCLFAALYYQVAWQYPVIDGFPLVERILDPQFNTFDFYTNTFADYSPRLYIANFFVMGSVLFDVHYTEFVAVANIVRIFVTFYALFYLFLGLTKDYKVSLVALYLSSLSFLAVPAMVAWWPLTYDITGSSLAATLLIMAWAYIVYNRLLLAYVAISLAVFFHPVVGVHGLIVGGLLFYSSNGWQGIVAEFKKYAAYVGGVLILIAFLANFVPYVQSLNGFSLDSERFIAINAYFKHSHHFIPSHFGWEKWLSFSMFFLFFVYMLYKMRERVKDLNFIKVIVIYSFLMMLLGWVFIELIPTRAAVTFIPYRAYSIFIPVYVAVAALFMIEKYKQGDYLAFLLMHLLFIPYNSVGLTWYIFPGYHELMLPTVMLVFVFTYIALIGDDLSVVKKLNNRIGKVLKPESFYKLIAVMSVLIVLFAGFRFSIKIPDLNNSPEIYRWLNQNISDKDLIVAELNAANNQKIRLISRRAPVISKDFPFLEKYYEEWYQRYTDVYVHQDTAVGHIDSQSAVDLNKLLDKYSTAVLLRTKPLEVNEYFVLVDEVQGEKANAFIYKNKSLVK